MPGRRSARPVRRGVGPSVQGGYAGCGHPAIRHGPVSNTSQPHKDIRSYDALGRRRIQLLRLRNLTLQWIRCMTRHLVICTDGTWNQPGQLDRDRMVPTNVAEVARALSGFANTNAGGTKIPQLVFYDTGIGTGVSWVRRLLEGATGLGLKNKILRAYQAIATAYQPGDKIFLFGFSRGAYTARSLAGLIGLCGIPQQPTSEETLESLLQKAFNVYRIRNVDTRKTKAIEYTQKYSHKDGNKLVNDIHFIGVWDTVGALGVPWWPFRWIMRSRYIFHDITLAPHIRHAHHAMAIDERRRLFAPTPWVQSTVTTTQDVEQVWFPGVHANVGGGYVDSGLADRALLWMCLRATKADLGLKAEYMNLRLDPNYHGELRESCRGAYRLTARRRNIGNMWTTKRTKRAAVNEKIHFSAKERFEHATEIAYRQKHIGRSLGRALSCKTRPIADILDGEIDCHRKLTAEMLNDGGGTPTSITI